MKTVAIVVLAVLLFGSTAAWAGGKTVITGVAPLTLGAKKSDVLRALPGLEDMTGASRAMAQGFGTTVPQGVEEWWGKIMVDYVDPKDPASVHVTFTNGRLTRVRLEWDNGPSANPARNRAVYSALRKAVLAAYDRSLIVEDVTVANEAVVMDGKVIYPPTWRAHVDLMDSRHNIFREEFRRIGNTAPRVGRALWLRAAFGGLLLQILLTSDIQKTVAANLMQWAVSAFHNKTTILFLCPFGSPQPPRGKLGGDRVKGAPRGRGPAPRRTAGRVRPTTIDRKVQGGIIEDFLCGPMKCQARVEAGVEGSPSRGISALG